MAIASISIRVKGHTPEDRCTNALVWLFEKCSPELSCQVLSLAGLNLDVPPAVTGQAQVHLGQSIPDAILEFAGQYVVIETKIYPGVCRESQLQKHYQHAANKYGEQRIFLLFLSVDRIAPGEVTLLARQHPGKVFFLSWHRVLQYLSSKGLISDPKQQVYLEQFFDMVRTEKLWRLIPMTTDELKGFLALYPDVCTKLESARISLYNLLDSVCTAAIASSGEAAEDSREDFSDELPCLYSAIKIPGWHTTP
ncbi:MAG TPA: hypothetical protein VMR62_13245, partial [Bryobacteraceae bacterium]|nr:hypothetical protein [Bryobacteraceae bacterium]